MNTSLRVGALAGIDIKLHWTFLLTLAGLFIYYLFVFGFTVALSSILLLSTAFFCVVLHELGHAYAAKRFNIPTKDITLYPIGGVARIERLPREPMQELWIALAGPAVNLAIIGVLYAIGSFFAGSIHVESIAKNPTNFLGIVIWFNWVMIGFNMIPAFPLDGGRVLRAGLATRMSFSRATQIAGVLGQGLGLIMIVYALFTQQFMLLFIAIFIMFAAQQEMQHAAMK